MKKSKLFLFLLSSLIMMSCASNIKTKKYASIDTSNFKTFACYASSASFNTSEFKTKSNKPIDESLISLINANMTVKGFSVDNKEPDMVIFLTNSNEINSGKDARSEDENDRTNGLISQGPNPSNANLFSGPVAGYPRYNSTQDEINRVPLNNGALVIEIFDRKSKELLWLGIAKDFKSHISDQTLMSRMVNQVFKKFPN